MFRHSFLYRLQVTGSSSISSGHFHREAGQGENGVSIGWRGLHKEGRELPERVAICAVAQTKYETDKWNRRAQEMAWEVVKQVTAETGLDFSDDGGIEATITLHAFQTVIAGVVWITGLPFIADLIGEGISLGACARSDKRNRNHCDPC